MTDSPEAGPTPGPYELHHQSPDMVAGDCDWSLQTEAAGAFLLFCHHPAAPAEANARLLAASWELREALIECADDLEVEVEARFNSVKRHPAVEARAALAKADGR